MLGSLKSTASSAIVGTRLIVRDDGSRLGNFLLNHLNVTPLTVVRLVKKYLVKVIDPQGIRRHPTQMGKLAAGTVVQLQGLKLPLRPQPLTPRHDMPMGLLKHKAESQVLQDALNTTASNAEIRILFQDSNLLIMNKPFNVTSSDEEYLKRIKEKVNTEHAELFPVNTLEKDESGIMVFAKNQTTKDRLHAMFDPNRLLIRPIYWAITTQVYRETPFGELYNFHYQGRQDHRPRFHAIQRYTTHQHLRKEILDEGTPAITQWRHLSTHIARLSKRRKLGLYEIAPITLRPHQLRVQLAEQLKTPVIGDWLYAPAQQYGLRLSPQLPLHLHLYQMTLPLEDGKEVKIKAPIPQHFVLTMNKFRMFLPLKPKLMKPRFPTNVKRLVDRYYPGQGRQ